MLEATNLSDSWRVPQTSPLNISRSTPHIQRVCTAYRDISLKYMRVTIQSYDRKQEAFNLNDSRHILIKETLIIQQMSLKTPEIDSEKA